MDLLAVKSHRKTADTKAYVNEQFKEALASMRLQILDGVICNQYIGEYVEEMKPNMSLAKDLNSNE